MLGATAVIQDWNNTHYKLIPIGAYWQGNTGTADPTLVGFNSKPMTEFTYISAATGQEEKVYVSRETGPAGGYTYFKIVDGVWVADKKLTSSLSDFLTPSTNDLLINKSYIQPGTLTSRQLFGTNEKAAQAQEKVQISGTTNNADNPYVINFEEGGSHLIQGSGVVDLGGDGNASLGGFKTVAMGGENVRAGHTAYEYQDAATGAYHYVYVQDGIQVV